VFRNKGDSKPKIDARKSETRLLKISFEGPAVWRQKAKLKAKI
jgi:hypothetical protein